MTGDAVRVWQLRTGPTLMGTTWMTTTRHSRSATAVTRGPVDTPPTQRPVTPPQLCRAAAIQVVPVRADVGRVGAQTSA